MTSRMNECDHYILSAIRQAVWSGFCTPDDVQDIITDILEVDAHEELLRSAVGTEFEGKLAAEAGWPEDTDCDRLDRAFESLVQRGIIALHNAGMTMSDGLSDVSEVLHVEGRDGFEGYCFYHSQDVERAVLGLGLTISFGDLDCESADRTRIGTLVKRQLEDCGFVVEWDGKPETRLNIPGIDWKRRSPSA